MSNSEVETNDFLGGVCTNTKLFFYFHQFSLSQGKQTKRILNRGHSDPTDLIPNPKVLVMSKLQF